MHKLCLCCVCTTFAEKLVGRGAVPVVMSSMVGVARSGRCTDSLLLLYHSLLLHLASRGQPTLLHVAQEQMCTHTHLYTDINAWICVDCEFYNYPLYCRILFAGLSAWPFTLMHGSLCVENKITHTVYLVCSIAI